MEPPSRGVNGRPFYGSHRGLEERKIGKTDGLPPDRGRWRVGDPFSLSYLFGETAISTQNLPVQQLIRNRPKAIKPGELRRLESRTHLINRGRSRCKDFGDAARRE